MRLRWLGAAVFMAICGAASRAEVSWTPGAARGLAPLSGGDGFTCIVQRGGRPALANKPDTQPASTYIYWRLADAERAVSPAGPRWVIVEYWDAAIGAGLTVQYDSLGGDAEGDRYREAEDRAGGWTFGTRSKRVAVFQFNRPRFAGRQNNGADFRISGYIQGLFSVRVVNARPAEWTAAGRVDTADIKPRVRIGAGGELIIGGYDPARPADAAIQSRALEASIPAFKSLGVTSHEGYVRWNLCEIAPGRFDWSVYDAFVRVYKKHGLKWVPFIILGSAYSLPDWYYKKPGSQGYICLEHGEETDVQSLWNPELRAHVSRFLRAFAAHYGRSGVIENVLLGVTGNYGEAIYVATGNDWTADIHGPYHAHAGMWCGDPLARASFRGFVARRYRTTEALRQAWGPTAPDIAEVNPFLRDAAPGDRAWLDLSEWYVGSMTEWSSFWMRETRRWLPNAGVTLCTGGHAPVEHGSDFGEQCRVAAEVHGGVRITNEASDYAANFAVTRWVASAARQYGAYFSYEPAGEVNPIGVVARIYNATTAGARGLHYYYPNLFGSEPALGAFVKWGGFFAQRRPITEIGVYYPETHVLLNGNNVLGPISALRDRFDFAFMSDHMIRDGGLAGIRALVLVRGSVAEARTWEAIRIWVARGGLLLMADSLTPLHTVEGATVALTAGARGRVLRFAGSADAAEYRDYLCQQLAQAPELSEITRAMVRMDGRDDRVYVSAAQPGELIWYNSTAAPYRSGALRVPPVGIAIQPIGPRAPARPAPRRPAHRGARHSR